MGKPKTNAKGLFAGKFCFVKEGLEPDHGFYAHIIGLAKQIDTWFYVCELEETQEIFYQPVEGSAVLVIDDSEEIKKKETTQKFPKKTDSVLSVLSEGQVYEF